MVGPGALRERLVALFALGVLLFSPPLLSLFNAPSNLFGVPLLYLYLFTSWVLLVTLVALMAYGRVHRRGRSDSGESGI